MTEQKLEKIVLDKLQSALEAKGIVNLQYMGVWQKVDDGDVKALEDGRKVGSVVVKVLPRTYDTPTIPDGQFSIQLSLTMRAEEDETGKGYMDATSVISSITHKWQKSYSDYATDFALENEFQPTGFNLESGDVGLDKENCVWTFQQTFTLYGIINFNNEE